MDIKSCVVRNCYSNSLKRPELSFFGLPKIKSVKQEWIDKLGPKLPPPPFVHVCELHFKVKDFSIGPKKELKCHAVPLLKLGTGSNDPIDSEDEFLVQEFASESKTELPVNAIKEEPLSDEEGSLKLSPSSSVTGNSGRRSSRRAAIAAAQKISSIARTDPSAPDVVFPEKPFSFAKFGPIIKTSFNNPNLKTYATHVTSAPIVVGPAPTTASTPIIVPTLSTPPAPLTTPAPWADISLDMECYEEDLSEIQTEIMSEAQNQYNLVMKGLNDLVQCSGKMVQTDSSGTTVLNTLPFPSHSTPFIPALNSIQPNTLFIKADNSKMIPISLPGNTKPPYIIM